MASQLLKHALPLVPTYGFTREALARSILSTHSSVPSEIYTHKHTSPLSDNSVSALFGEGNDAPRALVNAWLDHAKQVMIQEFSIKDVDVSGNHTTRPTATEMIKKRLSLNEPVLKHLPQAFALLATPSTGIHLFDPRPVLSHSFQIADEVCHLAGETKPDLSWYTQRASLAAVYTAAELHQLTSPRTALAFLDSLLSTREQAKTTLDEGALFGSYILRSWRGIIKSSGILP